MIKPHNTKENYAIDVESHQIYLSFYNKYRLWHPLEGQMPFCETSAAGKAKYLIFIWHFHRTGTLKINL